MKPPRGRQARRVIAQRRGVRAEFIAVWLLRLKGYRILARNYRVPVGEIDIVARRGRSLVAIEVKARAVEAVAAEAILSRQRRRVVRAAQYFLGAHPALQPLALRFDVILVTPGKWPRHLTAAWVTE